MTVSGEFFHLDLTQFIKNQIRDAYNNDTNNFANNTNLTVLSFDTVQRVYNSDDTDYCSRLTLTLNFANKTFSKKKKFAFIPSNNMLFNESEFAGYKGYIYVNGTTTEFNTSTTVNSDIYNITTPADLTTNSASLETMLDAINSVYISIISQTETPSLITICGSPTSEVSFTYAANYASTVDGLQIYPSVSLIFADSSIDYKNIIDAFFDYMSEPLITLKTSSQLLFKGFDGSQTLYTQLDGYKNKLTLEENAKLTLDFTDSSNISLDSITYSGDNYWSGALNCNIHFGDKIANVVSPMVTHAAISNIYTMLENAFRINLQQNDALTSQISSISSSVSSLPSIDAIGSTVATKISAASLAKTSDLSALATTENLASLAKTSATLTFSVSGLTFKTAIDTTTGKVTKANYDSKYAIIKPLTAAGAASSPTSAIAADSTFLLQSVGGELNFVNLNSTDGTLYTLNETLVATDLTNFLVVNGKLYYNKKEVEIDLSPITVLDNANVFNIIDETIANRSLSAYKLVGIDNFCIVTSVPKMISAFVSD